MTDCRDCAKLARFPSWAGYTAGCAKCQARAFAPVTPRQQFETRRADWLHDNPGAWPLEVRDACARLREECGIAP